MRSPRLPPLLTWAIVLGVCALVIGGSLAYARSVGDPLKDEEAARRAERDRQRTTATSTPTLFPGQIPSGTGGSNAGGGFFGSDGYLPSAACAATLLDVANTDDLHLADVAAAWDQAVSCTTDSGAPFTDLVTQFGTDTESRFCLAAFLSLNTLRVRFPGATTPALDPLVVTCEQQGATPGMPSSGFGPPAPGPPPSPAFPGAPSTSAAPSGTVGTSPAAGPPSSIVGGGGDR